MALETLETYIVKPAGVCVGIVLKEIASDGRVLDRLALGLVPFGCRHGLRCKTQQHWEGGKLHVRVDAVHGCSANS